MTLLRFLMLALAIAAGAVVVYGLFVESSSIKLRAHRQRPGRAGGLPGILGFAWPAPRLGSASAAGSAGRCCIAFVGGLFVLGAAGSLAGGNRARHPRRRLIGRAEVAAKLGHPAPIV